jgi:hypothetical protein
LKPDQAKPTMKIKSLLSLSLVSRVIRFPAGCAGTAKAITKELKSCFINQAWILQ